MTLKEAAVGQTVKVKQLTDNGSFLCLDSL